ncbi:hypothetical protein [Wenzhouxiangella sp. EGI_FJ10409]|uniref:hypothetical protein n=1 Tax=Wenzhouxiangella sp. EGI_FJ10409 TaxID=3243767 RepID=UPI0035DA136C
MASIEEIVDGVYALAEALHYRDFKVLLTLRRQSDLIHSMLAQNFNNYLHFWGVATLPGVLDQLVSGQAGGRHHIALYFDTLVEMLVRSFGATNVMVRPYEEFLHQPHVFLDQLSKFAGVANWADNVKTGGKMNTRAISKNEKRAKCDFAPDVPIADDSPVLLMLLRARILRWPLKKALGTRELKVRLADAQRKAITDHFRDSNARLEEIVSICKRYCYR